MRSLITFDVALCRSTVSSCLVAAAISGCAYPNQFRNVATSAHHALLTADAGDRWSDRGPTVFAINSQPTSFWRTTERFHIPPGPTTLSVIADREPYEFAPLDFDATAGRHYHLRYGGARSSVVLYDVTAHSTSILIKTSARDVDSSREASTKIADQVSAANRSHPTRSAVNRKSVTADSNR